MGITIGEGISFKKEEIINDGGCMATPPNIMSCLSWNCRGLGSPCAIRDLKELIRNQKPSIIFLMENRLMHCTFLSLKNKLGFSNGFSMDRVGRGGVLLSYGRMIWMSL